MANTCLYEMRLAGKRQAVIDVLHIIHGDGPPIEVEDDYINPKTKEKTTVSAIENTFVGRCGYDASTIKIIEKDGMMYADLTDECAWSVVSSMMRESNRPKARKSLEDLAEEYDVRMEVYSVEYGEGSPNIISSPERTLLRTATTRKTSTTRESANRWRKTDTTGTITKANGATKKVIPFPTCLRTRCPNSSLGLGANSAKTCGWRKEMRWTC